jgi:IS1 family transposase
LDLRRKCSIYPTPLLQGHYPHFGHWVKEAGKVKARWQVAADLLYAQVKKTYRRRKLSRVEACERCGTLEQVTMRLQQLGFSGRIQTAFIERVNLTLRRGVAALARRTWSTAQSVGELRLHLSWWRAYYHYVRPHAGLQPRSAPRCRKPTPAIAAGLTDHRWTAAELLLHPLPPALLHSA